METTIRLNKTATLKSESMLHPWAEITGQMGSSKDDLPRALGVEGPRTLEDAMSSFKRKIERLYGMHWDEVVRLARGGTPRDASGSRAAAEVAHVRRKAARKAQRRARRVTRSVAKGGRA